MSLASLREKWLLNPVPATVAVMLGLSLLVINNERHNWKSANTVVENHYNMESAVVETILCLLLWPLLVTLALGMHVVRQQREKKDN